MKKILLILIASLVTNNIYSQIWDSTNVSSETVHNLTFLNTNTGYASTNEHSQSYKIFKTTNKGINWVLIKDFGNNVTSEHNQDLFFLNPNLGWATFFEFSSPSNISYVYKTTNGGNNWTLVSETNFTTGLVSGNLKFVNENTGFLYDDIYHGRIYKTVNGGQNWNIIYNDPDQLLVSLDLSINNPGNMYVAGYKSTFPVLLKSTDYGMTYTTILDGNSNPSNLFEIYSINVSNNNDVDVVRFICRDGVYLLNNDNTFEKLSSFNSARDIKFSNNSSYGYAFVSIWNVYVTTNGGVNWNSELYSRNLSVYSTNSASFNQIAFVPNSSGKVFTRKLSTNLNTYYDNQSTSESLSFDWTNYSTPTNVYLRGGYSSLNCSDLINSGQTNERIFYKWSDGFMNSRHSIDTSNGKDFYFDASGTTIANYYKTKQLSTTSGAISNVRQSKVLKDEWGAINQIHQSLDGGIFYTKSYDNGGNYKREEIVNATTTHSVADGNKNPAICETRWYGTLGGGYPVNKNVSACWERYNPSNDTTEIKVAVRSYDINSDTSFKWNNWEDGNNSDVFASFSSSAGYNSFPKIFASALDPNNYLGEPSTYFFAIPHLRPYQGGNKLVVSCRKGPSLSADFVLDSGDISDLAVIDSIKNPAPGNILIHFAYRKVNQIIYRKELFMYQSGLPIGTYHYEGPTDVTTGDGGFPSRYTPDISLMGGIPVITYAASYDAWRTIQYEDQSTGSIQVSRYPIVKVQKTPNGWNNFVIYNSGNNQSKPDIEGSTSTLSYILNYSLGNGSFKKIANISGHPGSMCQPNIFSGTDSRLVNNSFTGSFGSNMSLLTLSPQSGLYKLDKQNFIVTNITAQDIYDADNLDGVVNLDTISYSFKVGPIYTQSFYENYYEINGVGVIGPSYEEPVIGGIEFNENLKSYPFLLNETQALLIGSNATYVKDNNYHSISGIPYTVNLYNKTTGLLHRTLFQDTIRDKDSVETESLRGYYITDIPNGADSFYVKLEVDEEFENAEYYINPIYEEDDYNGPAGDNFSEGKIAIIYENTSLPTVNNNVIIPTEYSLSQNYPNPFNPATKISYALPEDGLTKITVYDISGKEIAVLVNESQQAGTYNIGFNGINFASGVYFYRIQSNNFIQTKQMVLIK
jgi:photosystem II stability/assembly factor-like uncharacterized protein